MGDTVRLGKTFWTFSLATLSQLALDHRGSQAKHLGQ